MILEDFAYELPPELIAQDPAIERDKSRLLGYDRQTQKIAHHFFCDIVSILKSTDVLVVNNTQVIPVRLIGRKASGSAVELLLIKQEAGHAGVWQAMAMPLKKLKREEIIYIAGSTNKHSLTIKDIFTAADGQRRLLVKIGDSGNDEQGFAMLQDVGKPPLPPYIEQARSSQESFSDPIAREKNDLERYQTVFAKHPGAIAAPTAGMHFSLSLLNQLKAKGALICEITLHVGPGTFKPITTSIEKHVIEPEWYSISKLTAQNINTAKKNKQRVIAVGTTTCRALESAALSGEVQATESSSTSLFIKPGYEFKFIDGLITNFHLSKSSLLLLVAALMGKEELHRVYQIAIKHKYRFYSYGDAMLIL